MNRLRRRCAAPSALLALGLLYASHGVAKVPEWLQQQAAMEVSPQPADVVAVRLLTESELVVDADGKVRRLERGAVRILRRGGELHSIARAAQNSWNKVRQMRAWSIPASGKPVEVGTKDAVETSIVDVEGGELISDQRMKVLGVPGAGVGATVGFEIETEGSPLQLAGHFLFQETIPVLEARFRLRLPRGWVIAPAWFNHASVDALRPVANEWQWTLRDVPALTVEPRMPGWDSLAGRLFVAFSPPDSVPRLSSWQGIGSWMLELSSDRSVATPAIRAKAAELLAGQSQPMARIGALATFVQQEVRYVGIQLGIGGYQPHHAGDVLSNRYGDCKDKVHLLRVLLSEAGIDSIPVLVNTDRTQVDPGMPPGLRFDHVILAIRLPDDVDTSPLQANGTLPDGGRVLYFDPTDEFTPLGHLPSGLHGGHGLLALEENSQLVALPALRPEQNGVHRSGQLKLAADGALTGEIVERFAGEQAAQLRSYVRGARGEADLVKRLEPRLTDSLSTFHITATSVDNPSVAALPLEWKFDLIANGYARRSGDLLVLRPRLMGSKVDQLPVEEGAGRLHDFMLGEMRLDQDELVIELPPGYAADSLPDALEMDLGFVAYRSRTEVDGTRLRYSRSYEVREPRVPAARYAEYQRMNREIARDERAVVLLKSSH